MKNTIYCFYQIITLNREGEINIFTGTQLFARVIVNLLIKKSKIYEYV